MRPGALLFWMGVCSAGSMFASPRLARRIGLVRTMAFTHMPAQVFLIVTAFVPNLTLAIVFLTGRSLLAAMDVPARNSYVMAIVTPAERAAAASVTQVPRSLAAAISPLFAGWLLDQSDFGWPLVIAGLLKLVYDVTLLTMFRHVRPPEERSSVCSLTRRYDAERDQTRRSVDQAADEEDRAEQADADGAEDGDRGEAGHAA